MNLELALTLLLQAFVFLGGVAFAYFAAFIYEDEEGQIQDSLFGFWYKISKSEVNLAEKVNILFSRAMQLSLKLIEQLFGSSLFSKDGLSVSLCLSIASILLIVFMAGTSIILEDIVLFGMNSTQLSTEFIIGYIATFGLFLFYTNKGFSIFRGSQAPRITALITTAFLLICFLLCAYLKVTVLIAAMSYPLRSSEELLVITYILALVKPDSFSHEAIAISLGIMIGVFTDIVAILFTKKALIHIKGENYATTLTLFKILIIMLTAFFISLYLPYNLIKLSASSLASLNVPVPAASIPYQLVRTIEDSVTYSIFSNLPSILLGSIVFIVCTVIISGKLILPLTLRLIYPLYRYQIFKKKAVMWTASGTMFSVLGFLSFDSIFKSLVPLFK